MDENKSEMAYGRHSVARIRGFNVSFTNIVCLARVSPLTDESGSRGFLKAEWLLGGGERRISKPGPPVSSKTLRLRKAHLLPDSKDRPLIANPKGVFFVATAVFRR